MAAGEEVTGVEDAGLAAVEGDGEAAATGAGLLAGAAAVVIGVSTCVE